MSRDDYISKLFIKNQAKLNEAPSSDLWSKIETQLEVDIPTKTVSIEKKIGQWKPYLAAASIALVVLTAVYIGVNTTPKSTDLLAEIEHGGTFAPTEYRVPLEESIEDVLPITEIEKQEIQEEEDQLQKSIIWNSIPKEAKGGEIKIVDKIADIPLEEVVLSSNNTASTSLKEEVPVATLQRTKITAIPSIVEPTNMPTNSLNYAAAPALNSISNQQIATQIVRENESKKYVAPQPHFRNKNKRGIVASKAKKITQKTLKMKLHPRLQLFRWMLGKWVDKNESEGKSYEKWQLKSPILLQGKGYKLSSQNERIFEEIMTIEYRPNVRQVFLILSFNENQTKTEYMLTEFDNERIIFRQSSYSKFPDEVIIQRDLTGFTTIMVHNNGFLDVEEQRYLENRNRVSNVRAIRTLGYE